MSNRLDRLAARIARRATRGDAGVLVHADDAGEVFELVESAREGDRLAFAVIYDRFHPRVYRMALSRMCSPEDAEDVVSETFLRAWRGLDRFQWTGAPFLGWLLTIAHTQAMTAHRTRARRPATAMADVPERSERGGAPHAQEQSIERMEVQRLLELLPEDQRAVLTLRFYGGLGAEEIGQQLGKSAASVRQLQMRALERLARLQRKERAA
jgi:RNA polymerase sigma-70 factor (ECF subfamily)